MTDEPHPQDPNRKADGTFAEGNKAGGAEQRGRTTRAKRIEQLDAKYDTVEKLMALFVQDPNTGKMSPGPELLAMHPRDAALVMQNLGAIVGDDKRGERESFWDREEGKPIQRTEFSGKDGGPIEYADADAARAKLLGRSVPVITDTGAESPTGGTDAQGSDSPTT